jgi:hypothetical protein
MKNFIINKILERVHLNPQRKEETMKKILGILAVLLFLFSCDLSTFIGTEEDSESSDSSNDGVEITSFKFLVSENDDLTDDVTGIIVGSTIYVSLPWDIVNQDISLTPTITLSEDGYYSPTSDVWDTGDQVKTYYTTDATGSTYTLNVSIDSDTVSSLSVSDPFYYSNSVKVSIDDYTMETDDFGRTISIIFPSSDYELYYELDDYSIGFSTVEVAYYGANDLSSLYYGDVLPYYVDITSEDGSSTNTFTIQKEILAGDSPDIDSIVFSYYEVYTKANYKINTGSKTLYSWMYSSYIDCDAIDDSDWTNTSTIRSSRYLASTQKYYDACYATYNSSSYFTGTYDDYTTEEYYSDLMTVSYTGETELDFNVDYTGIDTEYGDSGSASLTFYYSNESKYSFNETYGFAWEERTSYTAQDTPLIYTITINAPFGATFSDVYSGDYVESYETTDNALVFYITDDTSSDPSGLLAFFTITAENESEETYFVTL